MRHTKPILILLALCIPLFQIRSFAQGSKVVTSRQRPRLPAQLDGATLQKLLNTIEKPQIASALKVGYFGGRANAQSLPVADSFELLKAALKKEPVASKRWFWLQNVRGWAAFRCREISPDEGYLAYSELFAQAGKAKAAGTVYAPQTALIDYISTINGRMGLLAGEDGESLRYDERTAGVLVEAWTAYVSLLQQTDGRWNGREPDWNGAIDRLSASDEFIAAVEKTLDDPKTERTFTLMMAAAAVIGDKTPQRAFVLYVQAKPLLPKGADRKIDAPIAERFFDNWLQLLLHDEKIPQAYTMLQDRITLIGSGHTALLKLQLDQKDNKGAANILGVLALPVAPESEVLAAASLLNNRWDKNRADVLAASQSASLLQSYLKAARPRSVRAELTARWRLGWVLSEQKKNTQAKAALSLKQLKFDEAQLDSDTAFILQSIRAMQAKLEAK